MDPFEKTNLINEKNIFIQIYREQMKNEFAKWLLNLDG
jgi:hypothetical protein